MVLDFKEIPAANSSGGLQDTFELLAREFFELLGYEIIEHPDRGADRKKDLIIQEARVGLSGVTHIKWMVSCKHYAPSGRSVPDTEEPNITERLILHKCQGFVGFYSTLPSTGLATMLNGLKDTIQVQSFDREQIEKVLLESPKGLKLAGRYFPVSLKNYINENPKPAKIFHDKPTIVCEYCSKDLLESQSGIFVLLRELPNTNAKVFKIKPYAAAYFSCKGRCDRVLKNKYCQDKDYVDEWCDLYSFLFPTGYIKKLIAWMDALNYHNEKADREAFEKVKKLFISAFPYISREQTTEEKEHIKFYLQNGIQDFL